MHWAHDQKQSMPTFSPLPKMHYLHMHAYIYTYIYVSMAVAKPTKDSFLDLYRKLWAYWIGIKLVFSTLLFQPSACTVVCSSSPLRADFHFIFYLFILLFRTPFFAAHFCSGIKICLNTLKRCQLNECTTKRKQRGQFAVSLCWFEFTFEILCATIIYACL